MCHAFVYRSEKLGNGLSMDCRIAEFLIYNIKLQVEEHPHREGRKGG